MKSVLGAATRRNIVASLAVTAATPGWAWAQPVGAEFWLVRHGESFVNTAPDPAIPDTGVSYPLTTAGFKQAQLLADKLDVSPQILTASTRVRAIQTADAVALKFGMEMTLAPELVEIDFGAAGQISDKVAMMTEVRRICADWLLERRDAGAPGGETLSLVKERYLPFMRSRLSALRAGPTPGVFVMHGALMSVTGPALFANVTPQFALTHPLANCAVIRGRMTPSGPICIDWAGATPA
uniref:Phosphoglycerate mutase n=1 Tax=Caulobacter sp. (strain K31) TaxID=366602 RepID=B0T5U3_CAUSK